MKKNLFKSLVACIMLVSVALSFSGKSENVKNKEQSQNSTKPVTPEQSTNKETDMSKEVTTESGLKYVDITEGSGDAPKKNQLVTVHYVGTLENGEKFDSSVDRDSPFQFTLGIGQVIKGWDEGVASMKVGGKRKLIIPAELGYGSATVGPIPANSTLIFEVELLGIE